jgi:hypothetical protein
MLSSVLNSDRAVRVNIAIMRVFVRLRETLSLHKELAHKPSRPFKTRAHRKGKPPLLTTDESVAEITLSRLSCNSRNFLDAINARKHYGNL